MKNDPVPPAAVPDDFAARRTLFIGLSFILTAGGFVLLLKSYSGQQMFWTDWFVIGLFPNIFLSRISGAAARVQDDFDARVMANPAPAYYAGPIRLLPARPEVPKARTDLAAIASAAKEAP